jgi:hypothetical protein
MLNFDNLTPKKFNLNTDDYQKIFMMFKDKLTNKDIAQEFNMATSQIRIVVAQIVGFIAANKTKYEAQKAIQKAIDEGQCSYKELLLPVNNEPTIGTAKVVNGKIYSDGILWK